LGSLKIVNFIIHGYHVVVLGVVSSNRIFSILYNTVFFIPFSREQQAVLRGKYHYYINNRKLLRNNVTLRRNIHRLEKGLLMRPARSVFALNYIKETVNTFQRSYESYSLNQFNIDIDELKWANDVLFTYFTTVQSHPKINKAKSQYEALNTNNDNILQTSKNNGKIPFTHQNRQRSNLTYDDLLTLSYQRRSVRWFKQEPVSRDLIDKALMVARQSPSACNRQPFEYKIYDDPELVKKIAKIPFGAAGYATNIPVIVVLIGKLYYYFSARDRHVIYIDASLSAMSFMYALETLGLSSSVINWPDFEYVEFKMQQTLNLKIDERPIMLMALGYPDETGKIAFSQKKSLDSIRSYNQIQLK
jgi:nitroreductase